jgi:regulator of extracellular matrix RemA (YlzA/DUF370 family)
LSSMISVGHNNFIPTEKISIILHIESRPVRKLISTARRKEMLLTATNGRKTRSAVVTTDGYVILSSLTPETLSERYRNADHVQSSNYAYEEEEEEEGE